MTYLLDVNLWIAVTVAEHVQHDAARAWFEAVPGDTIAFCRVTQMGFLRLLTNAQVMGDNVFTAEQAWRLLERLRRDEHVLFASEPLGLEQAWRKMTLAHKTGANSWTDTYLAAFAQATSCTLVTFDRGFAKHKGLALRLLNDAHF